MLFSDEFFTGDILVFLKAANVVGGDCAAFVVGLSVSGSDCVQVLKSSGCLHPECGCGVILMYVHMCARVCVCVCECGFDHLNCL